MRVYRSLAFLIVGLAVVVAASYISVRSFFAKEYSSSPIAMANGAQCATSESVAVQSGESITNENQLLFVSCGGFLL